MISSDHPGKDETLPLDSYVEDIVVFLGVRKKSVFLNILTLISTVLNRTLPSFRGGLLEIKLTVPLSSGCYGTLNAIHSQFF